MSRILLIIIFSSILTGVIKAQCPNSGYAKLETQADVNDFVDRYPDCTELTGELSLGYSSFGDPSSDISDLSGLTNIRRIGLNLKIGHLDSLSNLNGLSNIEFVGRDIQISFNDKLKELAAFTKLDTIGGQLQINQNPKLENINELSNLTYIGDYLDINKNENLISIEGLIGLTIINGYLKINGSPKLEHLTGIDNIVSTNGRLEISETGVKDLSSLSSFERTIGQQGYIVIGENLNLTNLSGLENLDHIETSLFIDHCPNLTSIEALSSLKYLGEHIRIQNTALSNLNGLNNVEIGNGFILIKNNENLKSISDLKIRSNVLGYLVIESNNSLFDISSLRSIDSMQSRLSLYWNSNLVECDPICSLLKSGNIGGAIEIFSNGLNCSSESEITSQVCTSGNDNISLNEIIIFPNPALEYITIKISSSELINTKFHITNAFGQIVKTINIDNKRERIDISELDRGFYQIIGQNIRGNHWKFIKI